MPGVLGRHLCRGLAPGTVTVETALYFPHIRVPETSWFAQILLYWDQAAAIVPYSVSTDESTVGRYIIELAQARLVEFVYPSNTCCGTTKPSVRTSWRWSRRTRLQTSRIRTAIRGSTPTR